MAIAAAKLPERDVPLTRRFELPDLTRHSWILPRLLKAWPHLQERQVAGFLTGIIYSPDYLFLYQEHGVALATLINSNLRSPVPVVHEIFVLAEDEEHAPDAASFYDEFARWAKSQGAKVVVVEELTDVPHDLIAKKFKTVYETKQKHVKV